MAGLGGPDRLRKVLPCDGLSSVTIWGRKLGGSDRNVTKKRGCTYGTLAAGDGVEDATSR